jgi:hypothetical protein
VPRANNKRGEPLPGAPGGGRYRASNGGYAFIMDRELHKMFLEYHKAASARFPDKPAAESIRELLRTGLQLAYDNGFTQALRVVAAWRIRIMAFQRLGRFASDLAKEYTAEAAELESKIHSEAVLAAMEGEDARAARIAAGNEFPWRTGETGGNQG